jgi:hypothetical protein
MVRVVLPEPKSPGVLYHTHRSERLMTMPLPCLSSIRGDKHLLGGGPASNEDKQGDELGTYVVLLRTALTEHGMTYGPRGLGLRSLGSSRGSHVPKGEDENVVRRAKPGR